MQQLSYTDRNGSFRLPNADRTGGLYFPLMNTQGLISSVTPVLGGDCKTGQNTFLLAPAAGETLHESRATRNFWVKTDTGVLWSITGASAEAAARRFGPEAPEMCLEGGLLWQKATRENAAAGLCAEVLSFVPAEGSSVEIFAVSITNRCDHNVCFTPTAAIPLYGRSADNIRDHRHVTSLLQRMDAVPFGVCLQPTLTFDERGHRPGHDRYTVLGAEDDGATPPIGFLGTVRAFCGEGGSYDMPRAVATDDVEFLPAGAHWEGGEMIAALRFAACTLAPGETKHYQLVLGINAEGREYLSAQGTAAALAKTKSWWRDKAYPVFETGNAAFDAWMHWVSAQPEMRRICGCSFLPHHDYGKGGRGWRDLWQDCLGLLLTQPEAMRQSLLSYFGGVRPDGTNANIIGQKPGEFIADRNNIVRVWMDHGFWPLRTVSLYLDQTGDISFLLEQQGYFYDKQRCRGEAVDETWNAASGTQLCAGGAPVLGTVLEHLILQHVTAFYDAGSHGMLRLRGADWNDGLDMARENGESVAFTAAYAGGLCALSALCRRLAAGGQTTLSLEPALLGLLKTPESARQTPSSRIAARRTFEAAPWQEKKADADTAEVAGILAAMGGFLKALIRRQEWVSDGASRHWFNSYYDNAGRPVEGFINGGVRMMLTGQVFALLSGTADAAEVEDIIRSADWYLYYPTRGGYCLNTDFGEVKLDLGRMFGFAYGSKENGAVFSHMAVMYAYALYSRGRAREGWKVLRTLFEQCENFNVSRCLPGIPEYFDLEGRGMYPYLTGAASWFVLTMQTQSFGVGGCGGDLRLAPQLCAEQFDEKGMAVIHCRFAGRALTVRVCNPLGYEFGEYRTKEVRLDGQRSFQAENGAVLIPRRVIESLSPDAAHELEVLLCAEE